MSSKCHARDEFLRRASVRRFIHDLGSRGLRRRIEPAVSPGDNLILKWKPFFLPLHNRSGVSSTPTSASEMGANEQTRSDSAPRGRSVSARKGARRPTLERDGRKRRRFRADQTNLQYRLQGRRCGGLRKRARALARSRQPIGPLVSGLGDKHCEQIKH